MSLNFKLCTKKFSYYLIAICFYASAGFAQPYTSISVFGDSANDGGNDPTAVYSYYKLFGEPFKPNADAPKVPFENYRFSDGIVATEVMATKFDMFTTAKFFNYSVGGAQAKDLSAKIDTIFATTPALTADPQGLYVLQVGQVDLNVNKDTAKPADTVGHLVASLQNLYNRGARHFIVYNAIFRGDYPDYKSESAASVAGANQLCLDFNLLLKAEINKLSFGDSVLIFDVAKHVRDIRANPSNHQITNITDACIISTETGEYCSNRQEHMYWDIVHFTGHVQSILGGLLAQTATLPFVAITSPSNESTIAVQNKVNIEAKAKDGDGTITKVEFYQNNILIGTDTTKPYSAEWTPSQTGEYLITAKAYDNDNNIASSEVFNVKVTAPNNQAPSITLNTPVASFGNSKGSITATATDTDGTISKVEYYVNGSLLTSLTSAPYTLSWSSVPNGTYTVYTKAYDNYYAQSTSNSVEIVVNYTNQPPRISLASPVGTLGNSQGSMTATATDADGAIAKVEFYVNDVLLGTLGSAPYQLSWSNAPNGTYRVKAKAFDYNNASTTSNTVTVVINR